MKTKRKFTVILEPEANGRFSVHCPSLPGCVSQGDTRKDALSNIAEAIGLVLEQRKTEQGRVASALLESLQGQTPPSPDSQDVLVDDIREILEGREQDGLPPTIETTEVEVAVEVPA